MSLISQLVAFNISIDTGTLTNLPAAPVELLSLVESPPLFDVPPVLPLPLTTPTSDPELLLLLPSELWEEDELELPPKDELLSEDEEELSTLELKVY